jgi:hypothetical protein
MPAFAFHNDRSFTGPTTLHLVIFFKEHSVLGAMPPEQLQMIRKNSFALRLLFLGVGRDWFMWWRLERYLFSIAISVACA